MARRKDSNEDESNENLGKENDSDDTFGLPDVEYKPLTREEETPTEQVASEPEPEYVAESEPDQFEYQRPAEETKSEYTYVAPDEESPIWPKVLGILFVIVIALGAALYFVWYKPQQIEKEKLLAKQKLEQEAAKIEKDRLAEEARLRDEAERRKADSLASIPKIGTVERLTERTGRYYVVIVSAIDGDLISDHANLLVKSGVSTKIIPPFGKHKFYRLTLADADTYAAAQEIANSKKAEYGENTWVLKY